MYACKYGWIDVVELLIEKGADLNLKLFKKKKYRQLYYDPKISYTDLAKLFIKNGAIFKDLDKLVLFD